MDWFKHDKDAHDDIKIRKLIRMHGIQAYGMYWYLVELFYGNNGEMPEANVLDECMLAGIQEEDCEDIMDSFISLGLFDRDPETNVWYNHRVLKGISESNTIREKMRGLANSRWGKRNECDTHATRMRTACDTQCEKRGEENITESSSYKNTSRLIRNKNNNSKLAETSSAPASETEPEAAAPSLPPAITIQNNKGEEVPISQDMVDMWTQSYPAVDVMAELRKMKAWCLSNPANRKTTRGMTSFINRWLAKEQDRGQRSTTDWGKKVSFIADGTRPEHPEEKVVFE